VGLCIGIKEHNLQTLRCKKMNKPDYIVIHHSATTQGDAETFRKNHIEVKGWRDIGYHYVVNNGTYRQDGLIEIGRTEAEDGAHCKADKMNFKSIGICLVGDFDKQKPTAAQMTSLVRLCKDIMFRHKIPPFKILGHGEVLGADTACPGKYFDMRRFRMDVTDKKDYEGHWAEKYIDKGIAHGFLSGYPDGTFHPEDALKRGENARILSFIIDKFIYYDRKIKELESRIIELERRG
jgi:N-acetylmuramoyl-L-alanine amidase